MPPLTDGLTFDLPNFVGELFHITPTDAPFSSMIGGLTGGEALRDVEFTWQSDDNPAASSPEKLEADEPVFDERPRSVFRNVTQIFDYGFRSSWTKGIATQHVGTPGNPGAITAPQVLGTQPVQNELGRQEMLVLKRAARDLEHVFLNGVYTYPDSNAAARQSDGIISAITTTDVAAAAGALNKAMIDQLMREMVDVGAPMVTPVFFVNSLNKQRLTEIYAYAPEHRNIGGVNVKQIETDFAIASVVYDRFVPASTVLLADVSLCTPVVGQHPEHGSFFVKGVPSGHSADQKRLYGEAGLRYGPEQWHGKITNTAVV